MKVFLISILAFSISNLLRAQQLINNWKSYPLPSEEKIYQYNNSDTTWFVTLNSKGHLIAQNKVARFPTVDTLPFKPYFDTLAKPNHFGGFRTIKKVYNGYLVGLNKGEFGGSLHWFSLTGDSSYMISRSLVNYIFENNNKVFIASGLAHLGSDYGAIKEMIFVDGKWKIGIGIDIKFNPQVFLPVGNKLLIVTSETIMFFNGLEKIQYIKKDGFWSILYPQTAAIFKKDLYIGMRGGIYKINLKSRKEEWIMPK